MSKLGQLKKQGIGAFITLSNVVEGVGHTLQYKGRVHDFVENLVYIEVVGGEKFWDLKDYFDGVGDKGSSVAGIL